MLKTLEIGQTKPNQNLGSPSFKNSEFSEFGYEELKRNLVVNAPLLLLGERGTGKTTVIEKVVYPTLVDNGILKTDDGKPNIQSVQCGSLSKDFAEAALFGYVKGAFTGANPNGEDGFLKAADGGILFLDEVQDLERSVQRKILETLRTKEFLKKGEYDSSKKQKSDFFLVCASNKSFDEVQAALDADFFDRIVTFYTELPPLRECKEKEKKLKELWNARWKDLKNDWRLPEEADPFELVNL